MLNRITNLLIKLIILFKKIIDLLNSLVKTIILLNIISLIKNDDTITNNDKIINIINEISNTIFFKNKIADYETMESLIYQQVHLINQCNC